MKDTINMWGPAIIVCLTVLIGAITNNKRIDDLRASLISQASENNKRMDRRIDDLRASLTDQVNGLRVDLIARIDGLEKRVVDRIERLERPVLKP